MKIRMTTTENGSTDGIRVTVYQDGVEYDLSATAGERDLASAFVGAGMAVEVIAEADPVKAADPVAAQVEPVASAAAEPPARNAGRKKK